MIISVSRRCDIPRFRFDWFLERLEAGYVDVTNPYNAAQVKRISLNPTDAEFFVFWTRDPRSLLREPSRLEEYPFYVMITLTGYPEILEPNIPPRDEIIGAMVELARRWGRKRVIWRYDPILLTSITDVEFHCENFMNLAGHLTGVVERVIISIYDEYAGSKRRLLAMEKNGLCQTFPHYRQDGSLLPQITELLEKLARIARGAEIEMQHCAEKDDLLNLGIVAGACIDRELIDEILKSKKPFPHEKLFLNTAGRDKNQRPLCRCAPSVDIGSYGSCPAACAYCYARR
jgi:hypothetical protein